MPRSWQLTSRVRVYDEPPLDFVPWGLYPKAFKLTASKLFAVDSQALTQIRAENFINESCYRLCLRFYRSIGPIGPIHPLVLTQICFDFVAYFIASGCGTSRLFQSLHSWPPPLTFPFGTNHVCAGFLS